MNILGCSRSISRIAIWIYRS